MVCLVDESPELRHFSVVELHVNSTRKPIKNKVFIFNFIVFRVYRHPINLSKLLALEDEDTDTEHHQYKQILFGGRGN